MRHHPIQLSYAQRQQRAENHSQPRHRGGHVHEEPAPPGKRYRLRGLVAVTIAGLFSWAIIILVIWLLVKLFT